MDQKKRDKIAWTLTVLLLPVLIYLVYSNIIAPDKNPAAEKPDIPVNPVGATLLPLTPVETVENRKIDPEILKEQIRISGLVPARNPFDPSRKYRLTSSPPAVTAETSSTYSLTGIIQTKGSGKRTAIINGALLTEGQEIDGWTISKIGTDEVRLEKGPNNKILRMRQK